jgi:hypothetical protein
MPSGWRTWSVDLSTTNCSVSTPPDYTQHLTINNLYNMNFLLTGCIDVAATQTAAVSQTNAASTAQAAASSTSVFQTQVAASQTSAAATVTAGGPTATPDGTATAGPSSTPIGPCTAGVVSGSLSQVEIVTPIPAQVQADGSEQIDVKVTVLDECGNPVQNSTVVLSSSRPGPDPQDNITPASTPTDGNGWAFFEVRSGDMSTWDAVNHTFANSTFSATAGGTAITDTAGGAFMCVGGEASSSVNSDEVTWRFTNDSGMTRRLTQIGATWFPMFDANFSVTEVTFDSLLVWSQVGGVFSPATINSGWLGVPADRHINPGESVELSLTFNFSVASSTTFSLVADWDNTTGASPCTSITVDNTP